MDAPLQVRADGDREKAHVALTSVVAAVFLTLIKVVVGVMTGSLGILAEALHSALDLVAAVMTYVAVRISALPPDDGHHYGHGKVENFSALFETLLLVITCFWIVWEGVHRLMAPTVDIDPSVWAFAVMFISIAVDYGRSRALMKAAKRYQSQALEADALHFSTDIWSSAVVIGGLVCVKIGEMVGQKDLFSRADAIAALGVAAIVLWVTGRLGKETIDVLMDRAPQGLASNLADEVKKVVGVISCPRVRVRPVGPVLFADIVIEVPRGCMLEQAHDISCRVEDHVKSLHSHADVVVHVEPGTPPDETIQETIQAIAARRGLSVHDIVLYAVDDSHRGVALHLEVDPSLRLAEAHALADAMEDDIKRHLADVAEVATHIEPRVQQVFPGQPSPRDLPEVMGHLTSLSPRIENLLGFHEVIVKRKGERLFVTVHCVFDGHLPIEEVHRRSSDVESALKSRMQIVERVLVHVEPPEAG